MVGQLRSVYVQMEVLLKNANLEYEMMERR